MPDLKAFKLPDVGEGLTEADILSWSVKPGDTVEVNQILVEVETAKAAVELPSPYAGVVAELHAAAGDTVEVGRPIITIDVSPAGTAQLPPDGGSAHEDMVPSPAPPAPALPTEGSSGGETQRQPVLVGYGPRSGTAARRARKNPTTIAVTPSVETAFNVPPAPTDEPEPVHHVLAKPPVRKLAKSLGVDIAGVAPTGPNGTVSRADVQAASSTGDAEAARHDGSPGGHAAAGQAAETRVPIKGVRKHTAAAMVASAFTAPHVTEFITVDVTPMMELRTRIAARFEFRDVKVSPLLFVAKAVILAVKRTPQINATWDEAAGEIVLKHYVNLGIAAATDRGLIVPNIKNADRLALHELAAAVGALTDLARSGKTPPSDMAGGTITITNVGVFGVDTGTPILNPGEAGIVAFGAVRRMPWVVGAGTSEQIVPRWVTQLAVSFDHRVVDGQQGSQFLADVAGILADPALALL
ncbi:MAG: dihydrolipoamide acetyltransferase family protein [Actinomycetota bacterium]